MQRPLRFSALYVQIAKCGHQSFDVSAHRPLVRPNRTKLAARSAQSAQSARSAQSERATQSVRSAQSARSAQPAHAAGCGRCRRAGLHPICESHVPQPRPGISRFGFFLGMIVSCETRCQTRPYCAHPPEGGILSAHTKRHAFRTRRHGQVAALPCRAFRKRGVP